MIVLRTPRRLAGIEEISHTTLDINEHIYCHVSYYSEYNLKCNQLFL